jgi:hypothetical protein
VVIFAAKMSRWMTENRRMGLDGYRSSYAGQNEEEKEVHREVGEICAAGGTGKLSVRITASYLFMLRRILRGL